ncbi:MAG TPA: hypothetical protein VF614_01205 [Chthoniobacteraceae bacterium]|jgi:hypothetical protein
MTPPAAEPKPLLFRWAKGRRFSFLAAALLLLSFFAHAAAFFVFTVVYPARVTIPAPAPQVTILSATNPDHQALLRWIEAEDPALVANAASVLPPNLLEVEYRPSYHTVRTAPRSVPEPKAALQFPPGRPPLELIRSGNPVLVDAADKRDPQSTRALVSGPLAARTATASVQIRMGVRSAVPLKCAQVLIGVADQGDVRFSFLQESSGDPAIDAEATQQLRRIKLRPAEAPITWGTARVFWGDDAYHVEAQE